MADPCCDAGASVQRQSAPSPSERHQRVRDDLEGVGAILQAEDGAHLMRLEAPRS